MELLLQPPQQQQQQLQQLQQQQQGDLDHRQRQQGHRMHQRAGFLAASAWGPPGDTDYSSLHSLPCLMPDHGHPPGDIDYPAPLLSLPRLILPDHGHPPLACDEGEGISGTAEVHQMYSMCTATFISGGVSGTAAFSREALHDQMETLAQALQVGVELKGGEEGACDMSSHFDPHPTSAPLPQVNLEAQEAQARKFMVVSGNIFPADLMVAWMLKVGPHTAPHSQQQHLPGKAHGGMDARDGPHAHFPTHVHSSLDGLLKYSSFVEPLAQQGSLLVRHGSGP